MKIGHTKTIRHSMKVFLLGFFFTITFQLYFSSFARADNWNVSLSPCTFSAQPGDSLTLNATVIPSENVKAAMVVAVVRSPNGKTTYARSDFQTDFTSQKETKLSPNFKLPIDIPIGDAIITFSISSSDWSQSYYWNSGCNLKIAPLTISMESGDSQNSPAGSDAKKPLVASVRNSSGRGVSGVSVTWTVSAGSGILSEIQTKSDSRGYVQAKFSLGSGSSLNKVTAKILGTDEGINFNLNGIDPSVIPLCERPFYVDGSYQGSVETGEDSKPFKTISNAIASVKEGSCVQVRAGTYREGITIRKPGITLMAVPGDTVIIQPVIKVGAAGAPGVTSPWTLCRECQIPKAGYSIYKTELDWAPARFFNKLSPIELSHFPDSGWRIVPSNVSSSGTGPSAATVFTDSSLASLGDLSQASIVYSSAIVGAALPSKIISYDPLTGTVSIPAQSGVSQNSPSLDKYLVTNALSLIGPEQWAVEKNSSGTYTLYYETRTGSNLTDTWGFGSRAPNNAVSIMADRATVWGLIVTGSNNGISTSANDSKVLYNIAIHNTGVGFVSRGSPTTPVVNATFKNNYSLMNLVGMSSLYTNGLNAIQNEIYMNFTDAIQLGNPSSNLNYIRNYVHFHNQPILHPDGIQILLPVPGTTTVIDGFNFESNVLLLNGQSVFTSPLTKNPIVKNNIISDSSACSILPGAYPGTTQTITENSILHNMSFFNAFPPDAKYILKNNIYYTGNPSLFRMQYGVRFSDPTSKNDINYFSTYFKSDFNAFIRQSEAVQFAISPAWKTWSSLSDFSVATGADKNSTSTTGLNFINYPKFSDQVVPWNDPLSTEKFTSSTLSSIPVATPKAYQIGDIIEINMDGIPRKVTAIKDDFITFSPKLPKLLFNNNAIVNNWGPNPPSLIRDYSLIPGSPELTMSSVGGRVGSNLKLTEFFAGFFNGATWRSIPLMPSELKGTVPNHSDLAIYMYQAP